MQDFGLEEMSVKTPRSPAGFGFDLSALLDDSSGTDQQMQSRLQNSRSRYSTAATSVERLCHVCLTSCGSGMCRHDAEPRPKVQVQALREGKQYFSMPGNESSSSQPSERPQVHLTYSHFFFSSKRYFQ